MEKVVLLKVRYKNKQPEVIAVCSNAQTAKKYIDDHKQLKEFKDVIDWHLSDRIVLN